MAPPRHHQSYSNSRASEMGGDFRFWPILLKKSLLAKNPIFSETLVRSWKNYVRAHTSTLISDRRAL
jgi:hypothetical protein